MHLRLLVAVVIAWMADAQGAWSQFSQYVPPGSLAQGEESTKERLRKAMEQARWRVGAVRLEPWVGLGQLTYYDDVEPWREGKQSDATLSAGAGLTAFLPVGQRLLLAGFVLPEYSWWWERGQRDRTAGRYGVGGFAELGRLSLDLKGSRSLQKRYIGFDTEVPVDVQRQGATFDAELRLLRRLSLYASAEQTRWRHWDEDVRGAPLPRLRSLDRDEVVSSAGLRYRLQGRLTASLGSRRSETDFLLPDFNRSNSGSARTVGLEYSGSRLGLAGEVAKYDLDPTPGSAFQPFRGRLVNARAQWKLGARSGVSVYRFESLAYTFGEASYYVVENNGAALHVPAGWRGRLTVFGERGTQKFVGGGRTMQDVRSVGAMTQLNLWRRSNFSLRWERQDFDELGAQRVRTYDRWTAGLDFGMGAAVTW